MSREKPQAIIFDVDGVLLDWGTSFLRWLHLSKGVGPEVDVSVQADYNIAKSLFPSRPREQVMGWIEEFSLTDRYASLLAFDGAIIEVIKIREAFPDWKLVAVTATGTSPKIVRARANVIDDLFPEISDLRVIPMGGSKLDIFKEFAPTSFVIEDALHHLSDALLGAGLTPVVFDQPYNRSNTTFARLHGWHGAAERLLHLSPKSNYHSMKAA